MKPHDGIPRFLEFFKPAIIDVIMDTGPLFGPDGKPFDVEVYMPIAAAEAIAAAESASTVGVLQEGDPGGGGHGEKRGYDGRSNTDGRRHLGGGGGHDEGNPKLDIRSNHDEWNGRSERGVRDGRSSHGEQSSHDGRSSHGERSGRSARHQHTLLGPDPKPPDPPGGIPRSLRSHRNSSPCPRSNRDEQSCYAGRSSHDGRGAPDGRRSGDGRSTRDERFDHGGHIDHGEQSSPAGRGGGDERLGPTGRGGHDPSDRRTSLEADPKPSDHPRDVSASFPSRPDSSPCQRSNHNEQSGYDDRYGRTSPERGRGPPGRPGDNAGSLPSRPDASPYERGGHDGRRRSAGRTVQDGQGSGGGGGLWNSRGGQSTSEARASQGGRSGLGGGARSEGQNIQDSRDPGGGRYSSGARSANCHYESPRRTPLEPGPKPPEHPGDVSGSLPSRLNSPPYELNGHGGLRSSMGKSVPSRGDPGGGGGRDSRNGQSANSERVSHGGRTAQDGRGGQDGGRSYQGQSMQDSRDPGGGRYGRLSIDEQTGVYLEPPVQHEGKEAKMLFDWKIHELDAACKPCRAGNIPLCDGSKPSCSNCQAFGGTCHYSRLGPLRSSISKIKTLVTPLRSRNGNNSKASAPRSVSPAPSSCSGYADYGEYGERGKNGEFGDMMSHDGREPEGKASKSRLHSALARIGSALTSKTSSKGKKKRTNGTGCLNGHSSHDSHCSSPSSLVRTTHSSQASSLSSSSSTSYDLSGESTPTPRHPPLYQPQRPPEPFQCTDCLTRCQLKQAWKDHESSHFPLKDLVQSNSKVRSNFFWNCGFCDYMSSQWEERLEHIGEHYAQGMTMGEWDPRKSPAPLYRKTLLPVPECEPSWHVGDLIAMQRLANSENKPCKYSDITPIYCDYCNVYFGRPEQLSRHLEVYHSDTPLECWACPALPDKIDKFFRQVKNKNQDPTLPTCDACQCCGKRFRGLNLTQRRGHLMSEGEHNFGSCRCASGEKFWSKSQFMAHLANRHMFVLGEGSKHFVDRECKEKAEALAVVIRRMEQEKMLAVNV